MLTAVLSIILLIRLRCCSNVRVFDYINQRYGEEEKSLLRKFENISKKYEKCQLDLDFLIKCKTYNIFPKFLQFKLYKKSLHSSHYYKSWQAKLLNNEINFKKKTLITCKSSVDDIYKSLKHVLSAFDFIIVTRYINNVTATFRLNTQKTHDRKLHNLGINNELQPCEPDSVVFNYSSINISPRLKTLLAFGLSFCLPVYKVNFYKYFLSLESLVYRLNHSVNNCSNIPNFLDQLHALSFKYFYNFKPFKVFSVIFSKCVIKLLKQLSLNKNIIICKPDKGRGVVILNKETFVEKMVAIISDVSKFEKINYTVEKYTLKIEDKINNFLRKLKDLGSIPTETFNKLYATGSAPGILYGLPKIHKPDFATKFQFRPIFAAYNNPSFKLAKFLVPILSSFTTNEYTVDNSYSFVSSIQQFNNVQNYFMCSFDIDNLFTNVPLHETIDICLNYLYDSGDSFMGLTRKMFKNLLELVVLNSFFIFDNILYRQKDGLGMGLPLAPTFANIFLCYHEKIWLQNCPAEFAPIFYRRYVDDTFILFNDEMHAPLFFNYLNSQHQNISFTMDVENNNKISFLDILIEKTNSNFNTSIFRKQTFSGLGLSYFSNCSFNFKLNSIHCLIHRAFNICSSFSFIHDEFQFLKVFFKSNGYPIRLVEKCINKFLNKKYNSDQTHLSDNNCKSKFYFTIPYFGHQSEKLKKELNCLLSKYFKDTDFHIILHNKFSIGTFFSYKDRLPNSMRSSLVYKFSCARCAFKYVGSTSRALYKRVAEHAGVSFRTGVHLGAPLTSSIRDHTDICDSHININNFSIIDTCSGESDLRLLESLYIYKLKPELNSTTTAYPLNIVNR